MYNPSEAGKKGSIFGLPYQWEDSDLVFLPVHLDATVSYMDGTAKAPNLILQESSQLDLSLLDVIRPWDLKMAMHPKVVSKSQNEIHRGRAINVIKAIESGRKVDIGEVQFVNEFCKTVLNQVEEVSNSLLDQGKIVAIVGGDHSSPLGLINALARRRDFGILQIDAHMDLRVAYEGFTYSHASIMYNVLLQDKILKLVQVGIRDYCEEEENFVANEPRVKVFYDESSFNAKQEGISWVQQCRNIVDLLPSNVYISFDMDGLDPALCPNTGTPVPGGLSFNEAVMLIKEVVKTGRKIIGFDVCETGFNSWDANVAARILYRLGVYTGISNQLLKLR